MRHSEPLGFNVSYRTHTQTLLKPSPPAFTSWQRLNKILLSERILRQEEFIIIIHSVLKTTKEEAEEKKRTMDVEGGKLIKRRTVSLFVARTDGLID